MTVGYDTPTTDDYYDAVVIQRAPVTGGGTDDNANGTVGTYATVATVEIDDDEDTTASTFTWTDENVAAGVYRYRAAGVIDGDTGAFTADAGNEASTNPGADTTGPVVDYSALVQDGSFPGDVNTGDQLRFIFDEAITVQNGDAIRLLEGADGTQAGTEERYTLTNGGNTTFALNTAPVVIGGQSYPANTILTVTAGAITPDATVTGGDNTLSVPAYVLNQSGLTDTAGNQWDVAGSDRAVNADAAAPDMTAAVADEATETVTVTYSAPVDCANTAAVRAQYSYTDATTVTPTAIDCNGTTVTLTFAALANATGSLTYTESATDLNVRVRGLNGLEAASPETQAAS